MSRKPNLDTPTAYSRIKHVNIYRAERPCGMEYEVTYHTGRVARYMWNYRRPNQTLPKTVLAFVNNSKQSLYYNARADERHKLSLLCVID